MAERSAEERINLWYQQFDHALQMSRQQFYSNAMATYTQPELSVADHQQQFQDAVEELGQWVTYLERNPAEVVQDRSDALAQQVAAALRQSPAFEPSDAYHNLTEAEQRAYEDAPYDRLEDVADGADPGACWQEQLAALAAKLNALGLDSERREQQHGMGW